MIPVTIVVLARYADIFAGFRESAAHREPGRPKILVRDGDEIPPPEGWQTIQGPAEFSMAGNANLGWRAVPPDHDIFYCGDDVRLLGPGLIETLKDIAYSDARIGIVSPRIRGGVGNPLQADPGAVVAISEQRLAFVAVYIKRALIESVGYLDERFQKYGFDDDEYCARARRAGWKLAVTDLATVEHLSTATYFRRHGSVEVMRQVEQSRQLFRRVTAE